MRYVKETPHSPGAPYKRETITKEEALQHIGADVLANVENEAARLAPEWPGITVLVQMDDAGIYVGVET